MERKIVTGLASFGMSGKVFHGPLVSAHPGYTLKTIVERSKNDARNIYPHVKIGRSFDDLLYDNEIELIIVNTPDHTHKELAHRALEAGKNVIVEKPFTLKASEGEDLLNFAIRKGKMISIFQNRRWDGDFLTVQKIIKNEMLGRLVEYETHFDRYRNFIQPNTWKEDSETGTGTLFNLGSHLTDQALVLFGIPGSVSAEIRTIRTDSKVDDFFDLHLIYDELKVTLKASYLVREPGPRFSLHGTLGSYLKYGTDPQEDSLKNGEKPGLPGWGTESESEWGILNTDKKGLHFKGKVETLPGNYLAYYDNIYDVLVHHKELAVKPEEAINVIKVIEAAFESAKLRKTIEL